MTRKALAIFTLLLAAFAVLPAVSNAGVRDKILNDCQDGDLDGSYTPAQLRDARQNLPGDVAQYTDCASVLRAAEIPARPATSGGGTGTARTPGSAGTGAPAPEVGESGTIRPNSSDQGTLDDARKAAAKAITLDPNSLKPQSAVRLDRVSNGLPSSLLIALAALAGCALLAAGAALRDRVSLRPLRLRGR